MRHGRVRYLDWDFQLHVGDIMKDNIHRQVAYLIRGENRGYFRFQKFCSVLLINNQFIKVKIQIQVLFLINTLCRK